ncbi:hypothetical protein GIB67_034327 [Kingdonia uniflora]|uniref:Pollen preferential protein n=1 Tax=Kingdonia uniflora TaxID=39325 RepID=A0A7J7NRW3_9MAGN|nr:hypothetical protein GIB67_034327 [Kingdonia uniflora]
MTRQIVLRQPSTTRLQPLILQQPQEKTMHLGEVAGGTAAECAAVCCCCPCGLMNLLVLAVYKLPAGICRKALKKKRKQKLKNTEVLLAPPRKRCTCGCDEMDVPMHPMMRPSDVDIGLSEKSSDVGLSEKEILELEKEMWDKFYSTGFWRSPSQRE